jgi:hypothetical protein
MLEDPEATAELIRQSNNRRSVQSQIQELKATVARLRSDSSRNAGLIAIVDRAVLAQEHVDIALIIGNRTGETGATQSITRRISLRLKRKGVEMKLLIGGFEKPVSGPNPALIKLLSRAHRWWERLAKGSARSTEEIASKEKLSQRYVLQILQMAFAAPSLVEEVVAGRQLGPLRWDVVMATKSLPISWAGQCDHFLRPGGS